MNPCRETCKTATLPHGLKPIGGASRVRRLGDQVKQPRLRLLGHMKRRDGEYIGRRIKEMKLPGRGNGKTKDVVKEDMELVGVTE